MEKPCAYPLNTDAYLSPLANLRRQDFQFCHRINGTDKEFSIISGTSLEAIRIREYRARISRT